MEEVKLPYFDYIKIYPTNSGISLRSKKDILNHMLIDYTLASIATYAFCSSYELIMSLINHLDNKYNINKLFNSREKELILEIYNRKLDSSELESITYKFEKCNIYLWALGFINEVGYSKKCSVKKINNVILSSDSYTDLLSKCNLISNDRILEYFNDINKVKYSRVNISELSSKIIDYQNEAIDYILLFNRNRDNIRIMYSRDDLRFEMLLPTYIIFDKLGSTSTELLTFRSKSGSIKMVVEDLKNINIQDDIKLFTQKGFDIENVNTINSVYLDSKIIKAVFNKDKLSLNMYYMIINRHLIRISSLNHKNNIDLDILLSIKMF